MYWPCAPVWELSPGATRTVLVVKLLAPRPGQGRPDTAVHVIVIDTHLVPSILDLRGIL